MKRTLIALAALLTLSTLLTASTANAADAVPAQPTYTKDIAPIFQAKCTQCHHAGTGAPMSLTTYEEVRPWARSIRTRVSNRRPWQCFPARDCCVVRPRCRTVWFSRRRSGR